MLYQIKFKTIGKSTLLINWPNEINESINQDIVAFDQLIQKHYKSDTVIETVTAYCSLTLYLTGNTNLNKLIKPLIKLYKINSKNTKAINFWKIPVCYDLSFGLDLQQLSDAKLLTIDEVIQRHSQTQYHVYFLGFLPGFPYLGGLLPKLSMPRLSKPRSCIPKGSVAIGNQQTGIYPSSSPGGWNIIGRTPVNLFDAKKLPATFIQAGDKVRFKPISLQEYHQLETQIKNQCFNLEDLKDD